MSQNNQTNHFSQLTSQIQKAPQGRRTEVLIENIAQQMQQSSDIQTQQLGSELQNLKPQLVQACQQQG